LIAVVGHEQIDVAVVVVVAGADALSPAAAGDACLVGDVGKRAVAFVSIQVADRCIVARRSLQTRTVDEKDVWPPVVVVVDDGDAAARRFEDVLLGAFPADHRARGKTGCGRHVTEVRDGLRFHDVLKRRQGDQRECAANEELHEFVEEDRLAKR